MRLILPSLVIFIYVFARIIAVTPLRLPVKLGLGFMLLALMFKYTIYEKIGGSFFAPDLPFPLLVLLEVLYSGMVILFVLLLVKDAMECLLFFTRLLGTSWHLPFSSALKGAGLSVLALILGAFATWQSFRVPMVRTVPITLPGIPKALDGFSIVQLSDLHIGPFLNGKWLARVVDRTNALGPDLVVLTGDMVDGLPQELKDQVAPLGKLKSGYGIYGVTGNHEYYFRADQWLPVFKSMGVVMLSNQHKTLPVRGGTELVIAGVNDPVGQRFGWPAPDPQKALAGAPDAFRVLLAHRPDGVSGNPGYDLQLSGHTHGGSLFFMKWLLASFNSGFVCGRYDVNGSVLYVNPGTGIWSGFSCRLGVPSEITRIVLHSP